MPLTRSGCTHVSLHPLPPAPTRQAAALSCQSNVCFPQLRTSQRSDLYCQSRTKSLPCSEPFRALQGPSKESLKGYVQNVGRRSLPSPLSSWLGVCSGLTCKIEGKLQPFSFKTRSQSPFVCIKQKDYAMALSSHLALRFPSVSSAPLALPTLLPSRLQDQKTAGSKYTPNSFHCLFPESPERHKKVELRVCVCTRAQVPTHSTH